MKKLLTIYCLLLISNLNAQILNTGFENWDSVQIFNYETESPSDWHLGIAGEFNVRKDTNAYEGDFALRMFGGYGAADGEVISYIQQKIRLPEGLDSISFFLKTENPFPFQTNWDFYGYGLYSDTINWRDIEPEDFVVGATSKDTFPDYTKVSFAIPDSLWEQEMYLTFYCRPINWGTIPQLFIDEINLLGDLSTTTQKINNQPITIFPNPTKDWIFIKNEGLNFSKIEVFSSEGKLLFSEKGKDKIKVEIQTR